MPRSLNKVLLIGYIADEPTVRDFPNGNKVARATLVTNEFARNPENGNSDEQPEWHRLTFWGNLANTVESYVHKGTRLFAEGRLKTRNYVDREGIKRYATEIICDNMIMLDSRRGGNGDGGYQSNNNFNGNAGGMGEGYTPISQANNGRANNFGPANNNANSNGGNFGAPMPANFNGLRNGGSFGGQNGAQGSNFNMAPPMSQQMPQPQMPQQPQRGYQPNMGQAAMPAPSVNNFGGNHGTFGANNGMPPQGAQPQPAPSANNFGGAPVNNFGQQPKAPSPAAGQNFTVPTGPAGNNGDDDIPF